LFKQSQQQDNSGKRVTNIKYLDHKNKNSVNLTTTTLPNIML